VAIEQGLGKGRASVMWRKKGEKIDQAQKAIHVHTKQKRWLGKL